MKNASLPTDASEATSNLRKQSVLQQYKALFSWPGVGPLILAMIVARMPTGCTTMLIVLFVGETYGASWAGTASAAWTVGLAIVAPYLGRLVDRGLGPKTLKLTSCAEAIGVVALIIAVLTKQHTLLVIVLAFVCGAVNPPVSGTTRSLWKVLVSEELLPIAYSFEILLIDALYVSGPLLASLFIALHAAHIGMLFTTVCLVVGSIVLANLKAVQAYARLGAQAYGADNIQQGVERPEDPDGNFEARKLVEEKTNSVRNVSLLRKPSVCAVLIACMATMAFSGWMETLLPLMFSAQGQAELGSIVISLWSFGSIVGVLAFVRIQAALARFSLEKQLLLFAALYLIPTCATGLAAQFGFFPLCVTMSCVGILVSPCTNLHYQVGGNQAPALQHAELFSWLNTATSAGISIGAFLAGYSIDCLGVAVSFMLPCAFAILAFLASLALMLLSRKQSTCCKSVFAD